MTSQMNLSRRVRVLICSDDRDTAAFMQSSLAALSQYDGELIPLASLLDHAKPGAPEDFDLAVIDVGDGAMLESSAVFELRRRISETPLIVISEQLDDSRLRQLFRLNGNDWLRKPLERKAFLEAITNHAQMAQSGGNNVHAVMSAVGGAGATSLAASLADAIVRGKRKNQPSVALFDLDFSTGAAGHYLNLVNDYDLRTVIQSPSRVDIEFIDIIKKRHPRGFSLLSFKHPSIALSAQGSELVLRMLDVVSFQHNHTVLDVPYYETPWKDSIIGAVNSIYLITELTIPGLRHAKDIHTRIRKIRKDDVPIHIVANKHRTKLFAFGIGKRDTRKVFAQTQTIVIEDDWATLNEAINRGVLPVEVNERSKFVRSVDKMAELVR